MGSQPSTTGNTGEKSGTPRTFSCELARAEYDKATRGLIFTKDFQTRQEALMHDPLATIGERVMAWVLRWSWGEFRLYAIKVDGQPAHQRDCAEQLKIDKRRVADAVGYLKSRGYLENRGKLLYPTISPVLASPPPIEEKSGEYRTFIESWKVAHSTDFDELEVARSTVKRITKVLLSDYKKSRAVGTNGGPSLIETLEINKQTPLTDQPVLVSAPPEPDTEPEKPVGRPVVVSVNESLKTDKPELVKHLETVKIPRLTPETVEEISKEIDTPELLEHYVAATTGAKDPPRTWGLMIKIAKQVRADQARYAKAAAGNGSPPGNALTREEQKVEAWLRRREAQGK